LRAIVTTLVSFAVIAAAFNADPTRAFARASGYVNPNYHYVQPYTRSDGRTVRGHFQTDSKRTKCDNYSTLGNVNPHTGVPGTKSGC
jgi:hypothetical protein